MKLLLYKDNAQWIIDSMAIDYAKHTRHTVVPINGNPDVLFCIDFHTFPAVIKYVKPSCLKYFALHHIDETKISEYKFDKYIDGSGAITFCQKTKEVAEKYIDVPIHKFQYYINTQKLAKRDDGKVAKLRSGLSPNGELLIGSFQKDGEGKTGTAPKLSKGPDVLVQILKKLTLTKNIKVVLAGYARQYVISQLEENHIPYVYFERYNDINSLYDCLDWYFVTARCEGGPQSVIEASYRQIKILSTDVGVASDVLHPDCICKGINDFIEKVEIGVDRINHNYQKVIDNHLPQNIIPKIDDFFEKEWGKTQK